VGIAARMWIQVAARGEVPKTACNEKSGTQAKLMTQKGFFSFWALRCEAVRHQPAPGSEAQKHDHRKKVTRLARAKSKGGPSKHAGCDRITTWVRAKVELAVPKRTTATYTTPPGDSRRSLILSRNSQPPRSMVRIGIFLRLAIAMAAFCLRAAS
jgi:hypothetical protein